MDIRQIPISKVSPSPMNPRKTFDSGELMELADNIEQQGLLSPITVRPKGEGYEIVYGERRFRAASILKEKEDALNIERSLAHRKKSDRFQTISAIVREMSDDEAFDAMITENLLRADVDPIEEAYAFAQLADKGQTIEEIATRFGKSTRFVTERVKLNSLVPELMVAVRDGKMPIVAALIICKLDDEEQRRYYNQNVNHYQGLTKASARNFVDQLFMNLDKSLWYQSDNKVDEDFTGGCGVKCSECPLNTANHGCLFYEMKCEDSGRCTDRTKFNEKTTAFMFYELGRMSDDLVKTGEPMKMGKTVVAMHDNEYGSDQVKELKKNVREHLDNLGVQVVDPNKVFQSKCWYSREDERTIEKLKTGEVYRVLNLFNYDSPAFTEEFWYVRKGLDCDSAASSPAEVPVEVSMLLSKYRGERNLFPASLVIAKSKAIASSAEPTKEPLTILEKQLFCILALQSLQTLRKQYGLSELPDREKDYLCVTQNPDFFDQAVRAWLQISVAPGHDAQLRQAEPMLDALGALWCPGEFQQAVDKAQAKFDKGIEKITQRLADFGYSVDGKQLTVNETLTTSDIMAEYDRVKHQHPDALLIFRMGDYYQLFKEDAEVAAPILGLNLAPWLDNQAVNQCGFVHRALDEYVRKLIKAGKRVAIIENAMPAK